MPMYPAENVVNSIYIQQAFVSAVKSILPPTAYAEGIFIVNNGISNE